MVAVFPLVLNGDFNQNQALKVGTVLPDRVLANTVNSGSDTD